MVPENVVRVVDIGRNSLPTCLYPVCTQVLALCEADVVIIDGSNVELLAEGAPAMWHVPLQFQEKWTHPSMPTERASAAVALAFGRSNVGHIVWQRYWTGALLVGVGAGVAALGRPGPWINEQVSNVEPEVAPSRKNPHTLCFLRMSLQHVSTTK